MQLKRAFMTSLLAIVVAVVGMVPATGEAQSAADQARANGIYKEAKEKFDANDFQKAFELAEEAERIFAHPSITFLKGRALRKLGRLRDADDAFKSADTPQLPKPLVKPLSDERGALSDEFKVKGRLLVVVEPKTALVSVDGDASLGTFDKWVLIGKRKIEIAAPGHRPVVRVVELQPGELAEIKVKLAPTGGSLVVTVPGGLKGVEILVDGQALDIAEGERAGDRSPLQPVTVGSHEVVCSRGDKRVTRAVEVGMDAVVEVTCEGLSSGGFGGGKALGWGGVAVGAGLLGYGAYGIGSYLFVDLADPRVVAGTHTISTSKHWGGALYAVSGIATGLVSYLMFVREPAAPAAAAAVLQSSDTMASSGTLAKLPARSPLAWVAGP